jgi:excisionase family DNA binding protein
VGPQTFPAAATAMTTVTEPASVGSTSAAPHRVLDEPLLTAAQVGALLGNVPAKTILQYARDGRLPCVRIGKHVRFVRSAVDRALSASGHRGWR